MSISKEELKRIAIIAKGGYSTNRKDQISADHWLRCKDASKKNLDIKKLIEEQKKKVPFN